MKRMVGLIVVLFLFWIPSSLAQSSTLLAFLNGSGQLVVSSGDGTTRWIITNPGQLLDESLGFAWTSDGNLIFAVQGFGVFLGDPTTQAITPVEADDLANLSHLRGLSNRPNLAQPQGVSPDNNFAFLWNNGQYALANLRDNSVTQLPIVGNNNDQSSGLWASNAPLVAYWGVDNSTSSVALSITHAPTGNSITASSGGSVPIPPIAWLPNSTQLIYRTARGDVLLADVGCVANGCSANPLESGVTVAPSSVSHVQVAENTLYYVDGQQVVGVDLSCAISNTCLDSRFVVGENVAPLTMMHVQDNILVYTAYASDPNNTFDRIIQLVDLTCVPNCTAQPILNGAVAGLLSSSADYLMIDIAGEGLNILDFANGSLVYLTDTMGGQLGAGLVTAQWQ